MSKLTTILLLSAWMILPLSVSSQPNPEFEPLADSFEVDNSNAVQAINIHYDDTEVQKQLFHLFLPNTEGNFPLVIFIHGGGFTGGNPGSVFTDASRRANAKYFLDNGFAYASIGYRLIAEDTPDNEGVIKSLSDSKRALQFIRYYSDELHIDPDKIAVMGTSAGAGTALWLATRSDMADPTSADPILRESTRVAAVVASGSQSTYDIYKWETEVYDNFDGQGTNFTLDSIAEIMTEMRVANFYGGIDSVYQIVHDPVLVQYREDVDMLFHISSADPPIYVSSQSGAVHPSDDVLHHSLHGNEIY
ncbi:MAG: alpha/beta hydrolase [Bacteroidota bacterium]